ncbi:class I SAM-dependent methyltransferase [Bdellovibrio bacteriovorus]|uniref:class I SAM-dependent methyltransferase n=1 Tax=Bdellovibrio TaxID=958 RepID=UPI0035A87327
MKAQYQEYLNGPHHAVKETLNHILPLGGLKERDCVDYLPAVVKGFFPHPVGLRALDLGSGHGVAAMALAEIGFQVAAYDMYRSSISIVQKFALKQELNISFAMGGILQVEQLNQKFDLIHDYDCLTQITCSAKRAHFLNAVRNSLAEGGKFVLKTAVLSPGLSPDESFESIFLDENYTLWRQTPECDVDGVVEMSGKYWTAQKRIAPVNVIRQELQNAGLEIVMEEMETPRGNHPATLRLVLTSAQGR